MKVAKPAHPSVLYKSLGPISLVSVSHRDLCKPYSGNFQTEEFYLLI